jgi:hypothetical protein
LVRVPLSEKNDKIESPCRVLSHVQHFLKTDYTEYSVQPNIRFEPNIRPNNRFSQIFVKTDYSAEYSDKTEYSVLTDYSKVLNNRF